jgi:Ni/Fe-hydrogenase subunit HybB-like protein
VGAGAVALIVPGVLLALMWSLAVPAKVLENRGVTDAMSRSSDLTKGDRGRIFVIWLLLIVLGIGVSLLLRWPVEMAAGVGSIFALQRSGPGWQAALLVSSFVSECLVGPLGTIAFSLVYYDQRVRKEAFDLQLMMTTLDAPALTAVPAQAGA